jgi:hypothetical protein
MTRLQAHIDRLLFTKLFFVIRSGWFQIPATRLRGAGVGVETGGLLTMEGRAACGATVVLLLI